MSVVIVAGHVEVDAGDRDEYVAAHKDLVRRAREAPGGLDLAITVDGVDPRRVNNFECWESMEHLDAWRTVAAAPDTEIAIQADSVMLYVVRDVRPPFG